jgi:hypothetical protein
MLTLAAADPGGGVTGIVWQAGWSRGRSRAGESAGAGIDGGAVASYGFLFIYYLLPLDKSIL